MPASLFPLAIGACTHFFLEKAGVKAARSLAINPRPLNPTLAFTRQQARGQAQSVSDSSGL